MIHNPAATREANSLQVASACENSGGMERLKTKANTLQTIDILHQIKQSKRKHILTPQTTQHAVFTAIFVAPAVENHRQTRASAQ